MKTVMEELVAQDMMTDYEQDVLEDNDAADMMLDLLENDEED